MFITEDGRQVETREEAATIYITGADGERYGPFTLREVGYIERQSRPSAGATHGG